MHSVFDELTANPRRSWSSPALSRFYCVPRVSASCPQVIQANVTSSAESAIMLHQTPVDSTMAPIGCTGSNPAASRKPSTKLNVVNAKTPRSSNTTKHPCSISMVLIAMLLMVGGPLLAMVMFKERLHGNDLRDTDTITDLEALPMVTAGAGPSSKAPAVGLMSSEEDEETPSTTNGIQDDIDDVTSSPEIKATRRKQRSRRRTYRLYFAGTHRRRDSDTPNHYPTITRKRYRSSTRSKRLNLLSPTTDGDMADTTPPYRNQ